MGDRAGGRCITTDLGMKLVGGFDSAEMRRHAIRSTAAHTYYTNCTHVHTENCYDATMSSLVTPVVVVMTSSVADQVGVMTTIWIQLTVHALLGFVVVGYGAIFPIFKIIIGNVTELLAQSGD